ncbi:hypothetical protein CYJ18_05930 [Actinomyces naeslundii]|nr:hypothetical protein BKH04_01115 [Actinomyces naeslundii]PKY95422.1 hypothetical protein CYJ18_05930 [Actinomyces naeslundii]
MVAFTGWSAVRDWPGRVALCENQRRSVPPRGASTRHEEAVMSKRGRKRRARAKSSANHGKRPNA